MMVDVWDLYHVNRARQKELQEQIKPICDACGKKHGTRYVVECERCYPLVLQRIKARYLESQDTEWFTGRHGFLKDLEALFAAAEQRKMDPRKIDARLKEEKRRWYVETFKITPTQPPPIVMDISPGKAGLREKPNQTKIPLDVFVQEVRTGLVAEQVPPPLLLSSSTTMTTTTTTTATATTATATAEPPDTVTRGFLDRLELARSQDARLALYMDTFFDSLPDDPAVTRARQRYYNMLQGGKAVDQMVEQMVRDGRATGAVRNRQAQLRDRLEQLRRARAGHQLEKAKKAKMLAAATAAAAAASIPDDVYDVPTCFTCEKNVDVKAFRYCVLCRLFASWKIRDKPIVFCNMECVDQGYCSHESYHQCASRRNCVSISDSFASDNLAAANLRFCHECVHSFKRPTTYCSPVCAERDFQRHRERVHLPERARTGAHKDDSHLLQYEDEGRTRYHAKDMAAFLIPCLEAVEEWERKNHLKMSDLGRRQT